MKKKNDKYTAEQTRIIFESFKNCDSYESQVLKAQFLANSKLFQEWNYSHTAKQILSKVSNMSRPAILPVLGYIKKPKIEPKPRKLEKFELVEIIEKILGYQMFTFDRRDFNITRYVLSDVLKMLLREKYTSLHTNTTTELGQVFAVYIENNSDVSEFINIVK